MIKFSILDQNVRSAFKRFSKVIFFPEITDCFEIENSFNQQRSWCRPAVVALVSGISALVEQETTDAELEGLVPADIAW
jgi:hypothetical protein